jgi:endonuclease III
MAVKQSFNLTEDQDEALNELIHKSGLQKGQVIRRALKKLAEEYAVDWPEDPAPGRPWPKERE